MYAVLVLWVFVLGGVLDRGAYLAGRAWRQPAAAVLRRVVRGERALAARDLRRERRRAERGLGRIDAVSQLATSVGLFGTVVGIAQALLRAGRCRPSFPRAPRCRPRDGAVHHDRRPRRVLVRASVPDRVRRVVVVDRAATRWAPGGRHHAVKRPTGTLGAAGLRGLTPLLDTVFLLLFALLSVSSAKTVHHDEIVRVQLPSVESGPDAADTPPESITLEIDADSRVLLPDSPTPITSRDELDAALANLLGEALPEEMSVEIRADRDARHGTAVAVLQHLRLRGFVHVDLLATGTAESDEPFGGKR